MHRVQFGFFDAGGGHRAAATALKEELATQKSSWVIDLVNLQELLDPLDILKKYFGIRIQDFYNLMLRNGWTLGSPQLLKVLQFVVRTNHRATLRLFEEQWRKTEPDMLVSFAPHFNLALNQSFAGTFPGRPFVTILTDLADFPPHFWMESLPQYFICGSERAVRQARFMGHPNEKIFRASGMILNPRFYQPQVHDRLVEREQLGLKSNLPTGLVLFGGHGSQIMLEIAERLEKSDLDLQLIFICGKNEALAKKLRSQTSRFPRFVEGFTSDVNYYMQLADFFIGKPGPGSVSEAVQMHLPVIVAGNAWTLPQERYNAQWVTENQVGIVLRNFREIASAVAQLIEPSALSEYRANAEKLENRAIFEIPAMLEHILMQSNNVKSAEVVPVLPNQSDPPL